MKQLNKLRRLSKKEKLDLYLVIVTLVGIPLCYYAEGVRFLAMIGIFAYVGLYSLWHINKYLDAREKRIAEEEKQAQSDFF